MSRRQLTLAHWGAYEVRFEQGRAVGLAPIAGDPDPSPIGSSMWDAYRSSLRIRRPAVRRSWLSSGPGANRHLRGREPFVEVSWDRALRLVAQELERVRRAHGNEAIFGGSYGWASAGRFHHAQSQIHRFLNTIGGYTRSVDTYSLGAARVVMPHIVASMDELMEGHHSWDVLAAHTRLLVSFGGVPAKNGQVSAGGAMEHRVRPGLRRLAEVGCRMVNISPVSDNFDAPDGSVEWIPIRPNTDTAAMLAISLEILARDLHDRDFLHRYCVGFERWADYLTGRNDGVRKDAEWASAITGIPAATLRRLALDLAATRSLVNVAWSLQRASHGEQVYWSAVGLASLLGQIGQPGGGFGLGYGSANIVGSPHRRIKGPTFPQGRNPVQAFIPVARIADMLLNPGEPFDYNGARHAYPDIELVYWAGGNPFHHHQDLNRLARAWRKPATVIAQEQFWNTHAKMADIVLPATSTLERDDIGYSTREPLIVAMKAVMSPPGEARDDFEIFSGIASLMGTKEAFTEGRSSREWLRTMYAQSADAARASGVALPAFDDFWDLGEVALPHAAQPVVMLQAFREDPQRNPLTTPSGRIEIYSERIASFDYDDCPGHPVWREPLEWLGSAEASALDLHLLSDQPHTKLHSQLDHSELSSAHKRAGRQPVYIHPNDAHQRGISNGDAVRLFNRRGACLATALVSDAVMAGVLRMATGAWWDPTAPGDADSLDRHGNPNVLTADVGASRLSQGCAAQSCIVRIEKYTGPVTSMTAFELPAFVVEGR